MRSWLKNNFGLIIIIVLAIVPLIFWSSMLPLSQRFNGTVETFTSIGQLTALMGLVLFSLNIVIATRLKFLDEIFFGLNRAYLNHHLLGGLAFILLLIHPLVLAVRYLPVSVTLAAQFLLPTTNDMTKAYGIYGLLLMIILLVLTFYLRPPYQLWKLTHKFLGLALFLASLHVYFIPSDVSRSTGLRFYMLSLVTLGLVAAIYRSILGGAKKWQYRVRQVKEVITDLIYEIELEPLAEMMPYQAGQFIFISFLDDKIGREVHPFSLASSPKETNLKFVFKVLGDYTTRLKGLRPGTVARIEGPFGKFHYGNFSVKQIWIAGGIGLTPFLGMARDLVGQSHFQVQLFYCVNNQAEAAFENELDQLAKTNVTFNFFPFYTSLRGRIKAKIVEQICGGIKDKEILLCAPPAMMRSLRQQFRELGVPNRLIHSEEFELAS